MGSVGGRHKDRHKPSPVQLLLSHKGDFVAPQTDSSRLFELFEQS